MDDEMLDRRAGVLVGSACGDALGGGYEYSGPLPDEAEVAMGGGASFRTSPGEWSDDTAMAVAVAEAVAVGGDPTGDEFADRVTQRWLDWAASDPPGMGRQTRRVFRAAGGGGAAAMRRAAREYFRAHPGGAAGNGALMRTAPLGLARLTERGYVAVAARIGELTHADPVSSEACGIWTYAVQHAVVHADFEGVHAALDLLEPRRAEHWAGLLDEAERLPITGFPNNGWVVRALQTAWAAIVQTPVPDGEPSAHLRLALQNAVRAGGDTDTVACIAGGLLGARWGASAVPAEWSGALHGWPGYTADDLVRLSRPDPLSAALSKPLR